MINFRIDDKTTRSKLEKKLFTGGKNVGQSKNLNIAKIKTQFKNKFA